MRFILRFLLNAAALAITFFIVDLCWAGDIWQLLIVAAIFGVVNALIRPIITILSCPLIILTLGLFVIVINILMLWLTIWLGNQFGLGFTCVPNFFWNLIFGALVLSVASWATNLLIPDSSE
ncbi:MAG: phage holin family protein [Chloroflexota bacterium]